MARVTHERESQPRSFFHHPLARRALGFLVITIIALIFIFQNTTETAIQLLVPVVTMPLWGALLIAWVLGLLASLLTIRRRER